VETYMRRKTNQKRSRKFRIQFPPFQFLQNEACLRTEEVTTNTYTSKQKVVLYISCNTIYRNVRSLSLLCVLVWFSITLPVLYSTNASHNLYTAEPLKQL